MKVLIVGASPNSLHNFRGDLINLISKMGHKVFAISGEANKSDLETIERLGASFRHYYIKRTGLNPFSELFTIMSLAKLVYSVKPELLISYTIKPVIYTGIISRILGYRRFFCLITGLGYTFYRDTKLKKVLNIIVVYLYKFSLSNAEEVIFQNPDDMKTFIDLKILDKKKCHLVGGSGVNLMKFKKAPLTQSPTFLLVARLLKNKGVIEYIEAAKIVKNVYPQAQFSIVGPVDPSPNGLDLSLIKQAEDLGSITYHGATDNVMRFLSEHNVFVLPSYHEGLPRSVLEAMAVGRPIITTNAPGCRETVDNGRNGWLVEVGNCQELAERIIWFIENSDKWQEMGDASFDIVKQKFDVEKVNQELLKIMKIDYEETV